MSINDDFPRSSDSSSAPSAPSPASAPERPRYGALRDPADPNTNVPLPGEPGYDSPGDQSYGGNPYNSHQGQPYGGYGSYGGYGEQSYGQPYPDYGATPYGSSYGGGAYPTGAYPYYGPGDGSGFPIGPVGRSRNPITTAVLALVTLGIYPIYWWYVTFRDLYEYRSGRGLTPAIALLLAIFFSIPLPFILCSQVEEAQRESGLAPNISITTAFWYLVASVGVGGASLFINIDSSSPMVLLWLGLSAIAALACQFYFWYRAQTAINYLWSVDGYRPY